MLERIGLRVVALRVLLPLPLDRLDDIDVVPIGQAVLVGRPADLLEWVGSPSGLKVARRDEQRLSLPVRAAEGLVNPIGGLAKSHRLLGARSPRPRSTDPEVGLSEGLVELRLDLGWGGGQTRSRVTSQPVGEIRIDRSFRSHCPGYSRSRNGLNRRARPWRASSSGGRGS